MVAWSIRNRLLELRVELADGQTVATLHFLYRVVEFLFQSIGKKYLLKMAEDFDLLLGLDGALAFLLVFLVDELLLKSFTLMHLFLKPSLLLNNELFLAFLKIL